MSYCLSHTSVLLGITSDTSSALELDLHPLSVPLISLDNGQTISAAFCAINSNNKLSRIIALLQLSIEPYINDCNIDFAQTPVFWLLPELAISDKQPLIEWASALKKYFPSLFRHPKTQFFPFGSSALAISLKKVPDVLQADNVEQICIIAVDTLFHELNVLSSKNVFLTAESGEGLIPSEGVAMCCITNASDGINVLATQNAPSIPQQRTQGVETLFSFVSNTLQTNRDDKQISHLYLPGNGLPSITAPWINAYARLVGHVDQHTQLKQMGLFSGELGCVTGLYNFLHIYFAYQHQKMTGNAVQLDISERLYQAINVYSWTNKDA